MKLLNPYFLENYNLHTLDNGAQSFVRKLAKVNLKSLKIIFVLLNDIRNQNRYITFEEYFVAYTKIRGCKMQLT